MTTGEISFLIRKEIMLEWRQKYAFNGLLLYVISTVFVCYLSFVQIVDPPTWNALFWIIQLFAGVNAISKSFMQESRGRMLYYYTIADPRSFILSRIIYNLFLMLILSGFNLLFYSLFIGNPVQNMPMFILAMILGSSGFAATLSMVSAIASKAGNNFTLMSILSFPILLPLLLVTIRFSKNAMDGLAWSVSQSLVVILVAFIAMIVALAYVLFPYLWKE
ncbi:MAG: heme exporter protein CcmB [Bacteroidia bacterium]